MKLGQDEKDVSMYLILVAVVAALMSVSYLGLSIYQKNLQIELNKLQIEGCKL